MHAITKPVAVLLAVLAASGTVAQRPAAGSKRIPDGVYKCQTWIGNSYVSMGTIRSVNNSLDTNLLKKVGATFTGATPTATGITVNYKTKRGYSETMDCAR